MIDASCSLIFKDKQLVGISLVATAQQEAENFCRAFLINLSIGNAQVIIEGNAITFEK